jgi:hypothetical protein
VENHICRPTFTWAAQTFVWAFFLLIITPTVITTNTFGIPIKPTLVYAVIAFGLAFTAILHADASFRGARAFFLAFAVLVVIIGLTYRGENIGGDYGGLLLRDGIPSNISYVVWPGLNFIAACSLFALAQRFRRAIIAAAFAALVLQVVTMEIDMWWPAAFGVAGGRAGGVAQNANMAALLVVVLASLTLPNRLGQRFNTCAPYAMTLMVTAVVLSQSRGGIILGAICLLCAAVAAWKGVMRWPSPVFSVALFAVMGGTIWLSPVLNPDRRIASSAVALEVPLTLTERFEARASMDRSAVLRHEAVFFFADIAKQHPFGIGTGFTNKYQTGPHNTFLKLAVDNGILAAIAFAIMLGAATWQAVRLSSPALLSICLAAWAASMLSHTLLVEPLIPAALAIGLAALQPPKDAMAQAIRRIRDHAWRWP